MDEILEVLGFAAVLAGLALWSPVLALVVTGLLLIVLANTRANARR